MEQRPRDRVAQWAFDTRSILGRFHVWLEDVEEAEPLGADGGSESFVGSSLERALVVAAAVTALGTKVFGGYATGKGLEKNELNRVKKDADAVSAYAMSEALWYLTRALPENHAIMVCLGEGLMPKAGETPEMGSNPLLGFGRVYARPQVARFLEARVHRLINNPVYTWERFWDNLRDEGITVWGAAIDTLENTSRFAKGASTGPLTVLHLFDQPLQVTAPYEGYVGTLCVPRSVAEAAEDRSVLLSYRTPRRLVLEAISAAYPDVKAENVHIWTLGGESREERLAALWQEWRDLGAHVIEDGWALPGGAKVFTESGTYTPVYRVGAYEHEGQRHLFLVDGYAASAEAIQAASLDPILETHTVLSMFSSTFALPSERERTVMRLEPDHPQFAAQLNEAAGTELEPKLVNTYADSIRTARDAGMPCHKADLTVDDFFPRKAWRVLAIAGAMLPDPYTGAPGVEEVGERTYRVAVRSATRLRLHDVTLTLRLQEDFEESRLVFSPLLDRFWAGEDYHSRPVKVSDSGRIRNELQTLCLEALEFYGDDGIRVHFDRIEPAVMPDEKKELIRKVLAWYKEYHPLWFRWLEMSG